MAVEILEEKSINYLLQATANLVKLPKTQMWLDYDSDADVLYLHFEAINQPRPTVRCVLTALSSTIKTISW